jgi:hypothetical protein
MRRSRGTFERRFGHERVQGAHHEREGIEPDRTPSRAELQQQERTGITGKMVKDDVTAAFRANDGPEALKAALEERGYILAHGDRCDYVVIDRGGGVHSLARRIEGMKGAELREFMAPMNPAGLPNIEEAGEIAEDRGWRMREAKASHGNALIEKAYARGDDYVSQTEAALKDHQHRQQRLQGAERLDRTPVSSRTDPRVDTWRALSQGEAARSRFPLGDGIVKAGPPARICSLNSKYIYFLEYSAIL